MLEPAVGLPAEGINVLYSKRSGTCREAMLLHCDGQQGFHSDYAPLHFTNSGRST